ncbi:hypothetical protein PDESU_02880 [Pontiella desulfatans]|uniref:Uncharacterized protein n=1 Tax=Pontiella desulfatans TaxID=2750659 RepID=A0A6C2U453_PONDE|nr:hypothetical protein [Pontiella desulfatans]VGO14321.1 hypothetical protein PDESU_02880 [Pontiella desulfatans]
MKQRTTTYNSLSGCLEAHFGDRRPKAPSREYREPEQGFRTIQFQSLPLKLNYMRRRTNNPLTRLTIGFLQDNG